MGSRQKVALKKEFLKESKKNLPKKKEDSKEKVSKQKEVSKHIESKTEKLAYSSFFAGKDLNKMVVYEQFPKLDDIIDYYSNKGWNAEHPLKEYGKFDIRELMIVIQYLYSFYQNEEYQSMLFGYLEKQAFRVAEGIFEELKPNLYFLVGSEKSLEEYQCYRNCFLESNHGFDFQRKNLHLIGIPAREGTITDQLGIRSGIEHQKKNGFCYYDYLKEEYQTLKYLSQVNIFDDCFYQKIRNYSGIEDTLSFSIHHEDDFIAKALISIAIFKKNHHKVRLTSEDYQYIFYEMFQDRSIRVEKEIERKVPKTLKYVPRNLR